jgi:large subunit ribosomal protein L21
MKDYEKMTVKELVEELTNLGVSFKKKARKAELIELLQAETEGKSQKSADEPKALKAQVKPETEKKPTQKTATESKRAEAAKSVKKEKTGKEVPAESGYAIIRTGGKQYQVSAGSLLRVEKIAGNIGDTVELREVLAVFAGDTPKIGQPIVEGAVVTARIVEQDKAKKVLVFKKKRRKGYRVKRGHRQMFTALEISGITV